MNITRIKKGSMAFLLLVAFLPSPTIAAPLSGDIRETFNVGLKGGSFITEDPVSGVSVGVNFPEGALTKNTEITLVIHGIKQPSVLGKIHINGITILPESLLFKEKVEIAIYNPPEEVTEAMILYRVVSSKFIIPLGSHEQHVEEGWVSGTVYSTGRFCLGTPTAAEAEVQCRKLAAYNPSKPLAFSGQDQTIHADFSSNSGSYAFFPSGGPVSEYSETWQTGQLYEVSDDEDCLRWQKALTKVEGHLTWVEQHQWTGNAEGETAEKTNAVNALQDAINEYLDKSPPLNQCGSHVKAAAKYLESAILLGMDTGGDSRIARHFNELIDKCSFVFSVETQEWINHPKETYKDGSSFEERSNIYSQIKCHTPWNEFQVTGTQKVRGEGTGSLRYENHWIGDEKEDHHTIFGDWRVDKIEGAIQQYVDDHGEQTMLANISIYWKRTTNTRLWGKNPQGPYDFGGSETETVVEHKSYPLENGYSEKIGNETAGFSFRVYILKSPGDGRDDPDDCF
jgi:hypothetical protein